MKLEKNRSNSKQLAINIFTQLLSFFVNIAIGFFLTPYIINTVGSTAYGYVGLANNFVSYVQILVVALNSMAGRFIAIHFYKDNIEGVQKYYTSVLFSNIIISVVLTVPSVILLVFLDKIINVPVDLLFDVRILWAIIFGTMLVSIVGSIFNNAAYVKNRLELISLRTVESNLIKAGLLIVLFSAFAPHVWYVGIASLICTIYVFGINIYYTKKLMPMVHIKRKYFDFNAVKELVASGIWNSVSQLGQVLSNGLDLLITNLFVGPSPMGIVSVSKTLPIYIESMFLTVASVFAPQLTMSYAKDDFEGMKKQLSSAMKIMGLFASIPVAVVAAYGKAFYSLWVPSQDADVLMWLTLAVVIGYPIFFVVYPLNNIFATINKVKILSITTICVSLASCVSVFVALQFTNHELIKMLVVVGTSSIFGILKNLILIPRFSAKLLNIKISFFYFIILKSIVSAIALTFVSLILARFFVVDSWVEFLIAVVIIAVVGLFANFLFLLNKNDREVLKQTIKVKIHR